ncbi:MAG: tRNA dimethylallyltransferase [candidate division TM6 bacterium GW2011_GWF2_43_17]|nr:MAG: tRNA dimethylallyltransferase [candidate division TM6 bacterium GW2011_GWF2_43_17]
MKKFLISVIGPTGSGKTGFALELAKHFPIEIVNADIGQMYRPFTIGVAQPTDQEKRICSHHLFQFILEPADFCVAEYRQRVGKLIEEIWLRGAIPVIVGGSTFYQQALFFEQAVGISSQLRCRSDNTFSDAFSNHTALWEQLHLFDPVRAAAIHPNDSYRLRRALEIWHATGKKPSSFAPKFSPLASQGIAIFLRLPREVLYERINQRTHEMLQLGWLEEVADLPEDWRHFAQRKGLIGYYELEQMLADKQPIKTTISAIQQQTRNYAKRQETFFRKLNRELARYKWPEACICDLTLSNLNLYIKQIKSMYES